MEKKKIAFLEFIFNIFMVLLISLFAYVFVTIYRGKVPTFFGYGFLRVISTSMEPGINHDDMIIVKEINTDDIKVGDIITFKSRDPYIHGFYNTHRVMEIIENGESNQREFVTKGDANDSADYYSAWASKVVGIYQDKVPGGRSVVRLINLMKNRMIYFIIMVLPVLICFFHSLYMIIDYFVNINNKEN